MSKQLPDDPGRAAAQAWGQQALSSRVAWIGRLRGLVAREAERLAALVAERRGVAPTEALVTEVLPLLDACRFLEQETARLLRPRRLGRPGRPGWLLGVQGEVRRVPHGVVLVIGPSNYPLLLAGVQTLQALVAGNGVLLKPAPGCSAVAVALAERCRAAGLSENVLNVLDESLDAVDQAFADGVDHVVLTGSLASGQAVLARAAEQVVPATVELSGCDAVIVLPEADVEMAAGAVAFGQRLNAGQTCLAPRRIYVPEALAPALGSQLAGRLAEQPEQRIPDQVAARLVPAMQAACERGAVLASGRLEPVPVGPWLLTSVPLDEALLDEDLFAPWCAVVPTASTADAVSAVNGSRYRLGAAVFGPANEAERVARQLVVGTVTINDVIVPTADPRLPFGGRGQSGFGVTRGAEGLLAMTVLQVITSTAGRWRPQYEPPDPTDGELFVSWVQAAHAPNWSERLAGWRRLVRALLSRRRGTSDGSS